jgi:uncharacterized protein (DUF2141 family)
MRFPEFVRVLAAVLCLAPAMVWADLPNLKVTVSGAIPAEGYVEVTIFDSEETFMRSPFLQERGKVDENGQFVAEFFGIVEGNYAIVVVHDRNHNGVLDTGFLGFGGELIGYSNGVTTWFGRPDFEDVKIGVESENVEVEIALH